MTSILQITFRKLGLVASLAVLFIVSPVNAESFICDATQTSSKTLPVLSESCPIGLGLWGKQLPPKGSNSFWIQCGMFGKPLSLAEAKSIYDVITTDVWMKPEKNNFRCLIGPYESYPTAKAELKKVQGATRYKQAFIRAFGQTVPQQTASAQPKKHTPVQTAKAPLPQTPKPVSAPKPKAELPKAAANPQPKPETMALASQANSNIVIRKKVKMDGFEFVIPFIDGKSVQFYMEYDKPWNRMSYADALKTCDSLGMKLSTVPQWRKLLNTGLMKTEKWPIYLPYWGQDSVGLFTSGKTSQLKGTSLLNVMCVRL